MTNEELLRVLQDRFEKNRSRHQGLAWLNVELRLEMDTKKLRTLNEMEKTGGEPDVIGQDETTGEFIFVDCSAESPKGRRNVCYDRKAQEERQKKGVYPEGNVIDMAAPGGFVVR